MSKTVNMCHNAVIYPCRPNCITATVVAALAVVLTVGLFSISTVMAVGGGLAGGGTPAPTPAPGQVPVPTPPPTQPQPLQSACIQSANAAFASVVAAAIQQITTDASTGNAALVSAGTTALSNAITAYNTALAQYANIKYLG